MIRFRFRVRVYDGVLECLGLESPHNGLRGFHSPKIMGSYLNKCDTHKASKPIA